MTRIVLLDGGVGQELVRRSGERPTPLWSTRVMADHPEMLETLHADFMAAGASIATTNTYALHHDRVEGTDLAGRLDALYESALGAAQTVRRRGKRVAGSIGPLRASYRPETHPPLDVAVPLYADVARRMGAHVDLILCETVASLAHARAVLEGARAAGRPVWLSVTVDDVDGSRLRSGEPVADVCAIARAGGAEAVLANCSPPEAMAAALEALRGADLPFGAYANGFTRITAEYLQDKPTVDSLSTRQDLTPEGYADFAMRWVEQGATIVGGCCAVGPTHIAAVHAALSAAGHAVA